MFAVSQVLAGWTGGRNVNVASVLLVLSTDSTTAVSFTSTIVLIFEDDEFNDDD